MGNKGQGSKGVEEKDKMHNKDKVKRRLSAQLIDMSTPEGWIKERFVFGYVCVCLCGSLSVLMIYCVNLSKGLSLLMPLGIIDILSWDSCDFCRCVSVYVHRGGQSSKNGPHFQSYICSGKKKKYMAKRLEDQQPSLLCFYVTVVSSIIEYRESWSWVNQSHSKLGLQVNGIHLPSIKVILIKTR